MMGQLFNLESPFSRILFKLVDIVILNFLFILFCLPIVTIGASTSALYTILLKMIKNEERNIIGSFFISFKKNFFKSTVLWITMCAIGMIIFLDFLFLSNFTGLIRFLFTGMAFIFGLIYICILLFIFPYTARYEDTIKKTILNSLLMGISNVPYLLALFILNGGFIFIMLSSEVGFLSGLYFVTFGGFAFIAYLNAFLFSKVFGKYEGE